MEEQLNSIQILQMNTSSQQNFELPRYDGPVDHLRYGFNSLENQFNASHPVAAIQKGDADSQFFRKLKTSLFLRLQQ